MKGHETTIKRNKTKHRCARTHRITRKYKQQPQPTHKQARQIRKGEDRDKKQENKKRTGKDTTQITMQIQHRIQQALQRKQRRRHERANANNERTETILGWKSITK